MPKIIVMKDNEPNWNREPEPIPQERLEPQCRFRNREPAEPNRQLGAEVAQNGFAQIVDGSR